MALYENNAAICKSIPTYLPPINISYLSTQTTVMSGDVKHAEYEKDILKSEFRTFKESLAKVRLISADKSWLSWRKLQAGSDQNWLIPEMPPFW